jgi:predicted acylesterase/phospholipase RssA
MCQYPQALLNLTRQIVRRASAINKADPSMENNIVITLLPRRIGQDLGDFAKQLTDSLAVFGSAICMNAEHFERLYGKTGASETPPDAPLSLVINAWLDEREREHKYTIYEASPGMNESGRLTYWMQRCVEDADLLLLVGESSDDPELSATEKALPSTQSRSRMEMVLVYPADCQIPSGTAKWLAARRSSEFPLQAYHHVRMGNQMDFRRLTRRITGKSIGLTLSGGGARGWAHVGVLRALEEAQMDFDWVAGASMGAIVAAGIALGWESERICELAARFSDPKKLLDYTFPYTSLTSTKRITSVLQTQFGGADIEDTWHPFFCISADLTHGEERIHTSGALWKAVRASMAFPGIFAPVSEDGCILIDGGAANNLPIDRMREMCPQGTVIGVELLTGSPVSGGYDFGPSLSGWKTLSSHLLPVSKRPKIPHVMNIISGLVYSNNHYRLNESWRCADLLIKVPVEAYGLLDFDKYAQIIDVGYRAAQKQLQEFKQ